MIEVKGISKVFEDVKALNEIGLTIPDGCIYGMVGTNGAGKSTLLRLMTGIYRPDGGSIEYDGEPVYENPEVKKRIIFVPDELYFLPGSNMKRMAVMYRDIFPDFDMKRFEELAESFKLNIKKNLNGFSKGMKRQAALILALSCKADYLFFDETFDGLDPVMRNLVKRLICQDINERGATAVITSHSLKELEDTCDQLALLHEGGIVLESDVVNLKTSLFKVQVAFLEFYDREKFEGFDILHYAKHGSVSNIIVRGDREETVAKMRELNPVILDVLPLTLEEVFTYEVEALGYDFSGVMVREEGEQ